MKNPVKVPSSTTGTQEGQRNGSDSDPPYCERAARRRVMPVAFARRSPDADAVTFHRKPGRKRGLSVEKCSQFQERLDFAPCFDSVSAFVE